MPQCMQFNSQAELDAFLAIPGNMVNGGPYPDANSCDGPCSQNLIPCCPNLQPGTLFATFTNAGNTACADSFAMPINFSIIPVDIPSWSGAAILGGCTFTINLTLICYTTNRGFGVSFFYLIVSWQGCDGGDEVYQPAQVSCDPLQLVFAVQLPASCNLPGTPGVMTITITA